MTTITRPALNRLLAYAASAMVILASAPAFPCGAAFGPSVTVDPHQDIILVWKDNIETYVFQPTFCGTSTDFGLILPVPAPLSEKPSLTDQQAFTTAATVSQPAKRQVVHHSGGIGCASGGSELANSGPGAAAVVASGRVGFLDWVELAADTTAELTDWLTTNGYPYSSTAGWRNNLPVPGPHRLVLSNPGAGRAVTHGKRRQRRHIRRILVADLRHHPRRHGAGVRGWS